MSQIIVVSFTQETKAIQALDKLSELESFGEITIYEKTMVRKKENGQYEILNQDGFQGWQTLTGMAVGSLFGILAGPLGFVIGLYTGGAIGLVSEIREDNFEADFISKLESGVSAGTVSIIAEVDDDSNLIVDQAMKKLGAVVSRSDVDFAYGHFVNEKIDELDDEIAEGRAELKQSAGEVKQKAENKIAALKEKRKIKISDCEKKGEKVLNRIEDKTKETVGDMKSNIEAFGAHVSESARQAEVNLIKRRISRQEDKLTKLNRELIEALV
ncbi:DUF1269 domain-containing protein [Dyadobacter frigoris]|uniref:DUF1269 domain-containing protein n=1 Tax=Dyadobacter frigoris TaxID=2576211 RepID=A0A4U6CQ37_9BACT|nr:DUF1269 domain-containing protein [Dyadobacter frigoris]TKT86236.1 DUF1269 domain-containing protein [Dyadobacter frigoris]GLU56924.1 hypothetical protein Dfri01_63850 [Dyadobacter frigoris]